MFQTTAIHCTTIAQYCSLKLMFLMVLKCVSFYKQYRSYYGNSNGWISKSLNLADIYNDGTVDLTGDSTVWLSLIFFSDSTISYPGGGFVDNLTILRCPGTCAVETNSASQDNPYSQSIPWRDINIKTDVSK